MKHLALLILALTSLALGAQSYGINAGATTGGGVVMSSPSCMPVPYPRGPMVGVRTVTGYGLVAHGNVGYARPVYRPHTRVITANACGVYRPRYYRRMAPTCMAPVNHCGDAGFYSGPRHCR